MPYDPTQYLGAARYYLRGRPPYSADLARTLAAELGLDGAGHLVDVGSGPGTVGVALAHLFGRVTLVEPDPAMLAEARVHAAGLRSVRFVQATAEQLPELGLAAARTVTFGQSFHRTDRIAVAEAVHRLLRPGGSLVLIGHDHTSPAPSPPPGTSPIPHDEIRRLITTFLGTPLRSGSRFVTDYTGEPFEQTLARTSFGTPRVVHAPGRPDLVRDVDGVVAGVRSMSYAAAHLFGPRLGEFDRALRTLLDRHAPNGRFWEWPGDTQLILATR